MHTDTPGCAAWNADSTLASLRAAGQPGRPARRGGGSGVEPTSRDQQIELYESLFSARRPFLLTETHTANLSTGAQNINGPLAKEPLERSRRSQSSCCTQQGLVLTDLGLTVFECGHRGAYVGWGAQLAWKWDMACPSGTSLNPCEVLSWAEG